MPEKFIGYLRIYPTLLAIYVFSGIKIRLNAIFMC